MTIIGGLSGLHLPQFVPDGAGRGTGSMAG